MLRVGSFLPPMDSPIVNVPIPHTQRDLGGGNDDVAWISTAYSLGLAVFVPLSNYLSDRFGLTRVHRVALLGFLLGSGLCGMAWDLNSLIAFRVLTAVPGSIVPVVTIAMIYRIVPRGSIGTASFMAIMTNGLSWLPPHLVGYGGAMNNVMQRASSALGVAIVGVVVSRSSAQLTSDTGALQTPWAHPEYAGGDRQALMGLYSRTQSHIHATPTPTRSSSPPVSR